MRAKLAEPSNRWNVEPLQLLNQSIDLRIIIHFLHLTTMAYCIPDFRRLGQACTPPSTPSMTYITPHGVPTHAELPNLAGIGNFDAQCFPAPPKHPSHSRPLVCLLSTTKSGLWQPPTLLNMSALWARTYLTCRVKITPTSETAEQRLWGGWCRRAISTATRAL